MATVRVLKSTLDLTFVGGDFCTESNKHTFQALALFGLATVGVLDKDRVSRLLSVHLAVMLSVW